MCRIAAQSPGLRHSESQKLISGLVPDATAIEAKNGGSSRYLPSIRPIACGSIDGSERQNASSVLQSERNNDHLEQLRYFAALRHQKQSRH